MTYGPGSCMAQIIESYCDSVLYYACNIEQDAQHHAHLLDRAKVLGAKRALERALERMDEDHEQAEPAAAHR